MFIHDFKFTILSLTIGAACGLVATADDINQKKNRQQNDHGQARSDGTSEQRDDHDSEDRTQNSNWKKLQQSKAEAADSRDSQAGNRKNEQASNSQSEVVHVPLQWVTVAVDYDQDGRYDAWKTIYFVDFQEASDRSERRSQQGIGQTSSERSQKTSIQGEIVKLRTEDSGSDSEKRVIAQVENSQGRKVEVCLGPQSKLSGLKLSKGDEISADGVVMRKDGQLKLIAAKVEANGKTVTHQLTKRPMLSRVKGELTSITEAKSNRGDGFYLVGTVKTDSGKKTVHFGPKKQLSKLKLSEGDEVDAITRTGTVSGKQAAIALQVSANDETVKVVRQAKNSDSDESRDEDQNTDDKRNDS